MIKVLLVDDSLSTQLVLSNILQSDPRIKVTATATNGHEALECLKRHKFDVVTMDCHMPGMDGLEATRIIMETVPMPIIICSASWDASDTTTAFQFMDAGALVVIEKPAKTRQAQFERLSKQLIETVKLMSEIKVVKRRRPATAGADSTKSVKSTNRPAAASKADVKPGTGNSVIDVAGSRVQTKIVVIGASTGGPPAIKAILAGLPEDFRLPILVVQHISEGFAPGFASWLDKTTKLNVREALHMEEALPGTVYLAPAGAHMSIGENCRISLIDGPSEYGVKPAISVLFRSVAQNFASNSVGILLTGMGLDGALELKAMRDVGAMTIAQDQASCVVYGMPREASRLHAATMVLSPEQICESLNLLNNRIAKAKGGQANDR